VDGLRGAPEYLGRRRGPDQSERAALSHGYIVAWLSLLARK
jgi:hypothetical protein